MPQDPPPPVPELSASELRALMARHSEQQYVVLDVRQLQEFEQHHIPGSISMPVDQLEVRLGQLAECEYTVFVSSTGRRSRYAALVAADKGRRGVYNLGGGLAGWRGQTLTGPPALTALDASLPLVELLLQAMDLEKGAQQLYGALVQHVTGTVLEPAMRTLLQAEENHARALYGLLQKAGGAAEPFDQLWDRLEGKVMEGGEAMEQALRRARMLAHEGDPALLQLALDLELKAHDLYRGLAQRVDSDAKRQALLTLAQQEKQHARTLVRSFGDLAAALQARLPDGTRPQFRRGG